MAHTPSIYIRLTHRQFVVRRLDSEIALFNISSGKTHLLDTNLATVFDLLREEAKTKTTLIAESALQASLSQDDIENFIDRALLELQDIGLIEIAELP